MADGLTMSVISSRVDGRGGGEYILQDIGAGLWDVGFGHTGKSLKKEKSTAFNRYIISPSATPPPRGSNIPTMVSIYSNPRLYDFTVCSFQGLQRYTHGPDPAIR